MKDNLEDLLEQLYEQKEVPSQEFCQSVIQKMKQRDRTEFLWKKEGIYHKGILIAAIFAGIIILTGIGIQVCWQGKLQDKETTWKQGVAEHGNQKSDITEDPPDEGNGIETEKENGVDGEKRLETKNGSDDKIQVETENPSDEKNKVETSSTPDNVQEHRQDGSGGNAENPKKADEASGNLSRSKRNSLAKPEGTAERAEGSDAERTGSDADAGSGNQKPQIMETAKPAKTSKPANESKPMPPSETMPPQKTPAPWQNYIPVCSIETYVFSSATQTSTEEIDFPNSVFDSRLILSYEQLQSVIGEIEGKVAQNPDQGLQSIALQLKKYDQHYFISNALCLNVLLMKEDIDVGLQAVWVHDMGQGDCYLDIWLDRVYNGVEQTSGMKYYSSFVSVPQTIASQCNMVLFQFSETNV